MAHLRGFVIPASPKSIEGSLQESAQGSSQRSSQAGNTATVDIKHECKIGVRSQSPTSRADVPRRVFRRHCPRDTGGRHSAQKNLATTIRMNHQYQASCASMTPTGLSLSTDSSGSTGLNFLAVSLAVSSLPPSARDDQDLAELIRRWHRLDASGRADVLLALRDAEATQ